MSPRAYTKTSGPATVVIVPVRDQPDLTSRFISNLRGEAWARLIIMDNGSEPETRRILDAARGSAAQRVDVVRAAGLGIYEMWSAAFADAVETADETNVLITNNDALLPRGGIEALAGALRARRDVWAIYPDYDWPLDKGTRIRGLRFTEGVLGEGGMLGACFMLRGEAIQWRPLISDPSYEWWFGDNHLARQIKQEGGRQARLCGLPVAHENEGTARHHPELSAMKRRDRARWIDSERRHARGLPHRAERKHVPGTRVWSPGGAQRTIE